MSGWFDDVEASMSLVLWGMQICDTSWVNVMNIRQLKRLFFRSTALVLGNHGSRTRLLRSRLVYQTVLLIPWASFAVAISISEIAWLPPSSLQVHPCSERAFKLVEILRIDVPSFGNKFHHLLLNVTLDLELLDILEITAHRVLLEEVANEDILDIALLLGEAWGLTLGITVRVAWPTSEVSLFADWFAQRKHLLNVH